MKDDKRGVLFYNYQDSSSFPIECIGGKAYNTVKLYHNGLPVPQGIIIPATYRTHFSDYQYDYSNIIDYLEKEIAAQSYAVRSSAVGEDSAQLSWAGCFRTSLDVNLFDIPNHILFCQESLHCERAKTYAKLHKVPPLTSMGVLIQEYIKSDYHGVVFSVNPITSSKSEYVIELQKGESGMVVDGVGDPTIITVEKTDGAITYLSDHHSLIDANTIRQITNVANRIEDIINDYADIEWVISKNKLIITQARAITTLR